MRIMASLFTSLLLLTTFGAPAAANDSARGISKSEAVSLANKFYAEKIRMEGAVTEPHIVGNFWVFPLKVGAAGNIARDPVLVNRFTGKVSWAGLASDKPNEQNQK